MSNGPHFEGIIDIEESLGIIDIDVESNLHDKVDGIKSDTGQILQDTADIQPRLVTVENKIDSATNTINDIDGDVDTIKDTVTDSNYGNAALLNEINENEGKIDGVKTDTENIINTIGTPANGTVSQDIADVKGVLDSVAEGQGSFLLAVARTLEVDDSTDKWYSFEVVNRTQSVPTDLDASPTLTFKYDDGTDISSWLYDDDKTTQTTTPSKNADGVYKGYIKVPSGATLAPASISVSGVENGDGRYTHVKVEIQEYSDSAFLVSDRVTLKDVLTDTADIQPRMVNTETIVNGIATDIDLIKNKDTNGNFDRSTDSLEALRDAIDIILNNMSSTRLKAIIATKTTGSIANGGSETVALSTGDGETGFTSNRAMIWQLRVRKLSGDAKKIKVKGYQDSSLTTANMWYGQKDRKTRVDNNRSLDTMIQIVYSNKDASPTNVCYVDIEVTDTSGSTASVFEVEIRGYEME